MTIVEVGLGLLVGIILALTGAGGGILTVPLLVFVVGLKLPQAAPIGLMAVGLAAWVGAIIGLRGGIVRYKATALMASSGVLLAPVGVWVAGRVAHDLLALLFALVMFWVAFKAFRRPPTEDYAPKAVPCRLDDRTGRFHWTPRCAAVVAASGTLAGFLSGLLGVGGGFVLVPALSRFSDLPTRSITATSLGRHRPRICQRRVVCGLGREHRLGGSRTVLRGCGRWHVNGPSDVHSTLWTNATERFRPDHNHCCRCPGNPELGLVRL